MATGELTVVRQKAFLHQKHWKHFNGLHVKMANLYTSSGSMLVIDYTLGR